MSKKNDPTPMLGKPTSRDKTFTKQENALLDQITLEICEAWAKDLSVIKECHKKTLQSKNDAGIFLDHFALGCKKLNDILEDINKISEFESCLESQTQILAYIFDVRKEVAEVTKKLEYPAVKDIKKYLDDISQKYSTISEISKSLAQFNVEISKLNEKIELLSVKKWWEFWK